LHAPSGLARAGFGLPGRAPAGCTPSDKLAESGRAASIAVRPTAFWFNRPNLRAEPVASLFNRTYVRMHSFSYCCFLTLKHLDVVPCPLASRFKVCYIEDPPRRQIWLVCDKKPRCGGFDRSLG